MTPDAAGRRRGVGPAPGPPGIFSEGGVDIGGSSCVDVGGRLECCFDVVAEREPELGRG